MAQSDVIQLIGTVKTQDALGVFRETRNARQVFCRVSSVGSTEFHEGGRNGLKPELRFEVFCGDYQNESILEWNGQAYAIYRTYLRPGTSDLELYVERKGGTNGKQQG